MIVTRHLRERLEKERPYIELEWIAQTLEEPIYRETQSNGRIRFWGAVPYPNEDNPHILRVVTLEDGESVLTAFIDSGFRRRRGECGEAELLPRNGQRLY